MRRCRSCRSWLDSRMRVCPQCGSEPEPPVSDPPDNAAATDPRPATEDSASEFQVVLEVIRGPHRGTRFEFNRHDTFLVGRSTNAHFQLPDDHHFSRHHFRIEISPPRCYLMDLKSRNGTFVNGRRMAETFLGDGDVISAGETAIRVSLRSQHPESAFGRPNVVSAAGNEAPVPRAAAIRGRTAKPGELDSARLQFPGYEILGKLGQGGMGVVYRAMQKATGKTVALKVLLPAFEVSPERLRLFVREASILSQLAHPCIVRFQEMGMADERLFVATEHVETVPYSGVLEGESFSSRIRIASAIACRVLDALRYAHEKSLVHRDIKPSNILLSRQRGKLLVKLADFGLAKNYEEAGFSELTGESEAKGSPAYMSPEQIVSSRYARPSCDLYSLGVTLYRYLTGKLPFEGAKPVDLMRAILDEPPIDVRSRCGEIPEALAAIVHRALAKEPDARFATAEEFQKALLPFSRRS